MAFSQESGAVRGTPLPLSLQYLDGAGNVVASDSPLVRFRINLAQADAQTLINQLKLGAAEGVETSSLVAALQSLPDVQNPSPYSGVPVAVLQALVATGYDATDKIMSATDTKLLAVPGMTAHVLALLRAATLPAGAMALQSGADPGPLRSGTS